MLELTNINKIYITGDEDVHALENINLSFDKAEFVSVLGPSGCGKTTLLNILGGLSRYTDGVLKIDNRSTVDYRDEDWDSYRNHEIGFVFQSYNLINHLSILGNVELALSLSGMSVRERRQKAKEVLVKVGLSDKFNKKPNQLSNGQIQRVAIARAIVNDPSIILADEPTGALDSETSIEIMELLKSISKDKLIIMVTHNEELALKYSNRVINLLDGKVINDTYVNKKSNNPLSYNKNRKDKKTFMGFGTALKLSFFNLVKKIGKTIISSIAGGIGIIGIGIVIGISLGFAKYVDVVQLTTNTNTPVEIRNKTVIEGFPDPSNPAIKKPPTFPTNQQYITPEQTSPPMIYEQVENLITPEYLDYINNLDNSLYHEIKYYYDLNYPTFLRKDSNNNIKTVNYSSSRIADIGEIPYEDSNYINQMFDLLTGRFPSNDISSNRTAEAVLIVSDRNQLPDTMLTRLGFLGHDYDSKISFDELLNLEIKLAHSGIIYEESNNNSNLFSLRNNTDIYNDSNSINLKIVGIMRRKQNSAIPQYQGIRYTSKVNEFILAETKNAPVVVAQQNVINMHDNDPNNPLYSVLTGEPVSRDGINSLLRELGIEQDPARIRIYHRDSESRQKIIDYLEEYNTDRINTNKIILEQIYIQDTWLVDNTFSAINIVLILVAVICLFISVSLLSILTYISVIQRTPEIGILRSIGARKRDIARVFNAEAIIIGVLSALVGLVLTYSLVPVFNTVFEAALQARELIIIYPWLAISLLFGNVVLTLLIGFFPALIASRKDPIDALKSLN